MEIRLTPAGHLRLDVEPADRDQRAHVALEEAFARDWREGLFVLAAEKIAISASQTLPYWRGLAERYLTGLCHIPAEATAIIVEPPSAGDWATLTLTAPPMTGGEYLAPDTLSAIWQDLEQWARDAIAQTTGGLAGFLQARAPRWRQVGRVCFHLAENKKDPDRPFAFMTTYTAGFGVSGEVRHLPLAKALAQYAGEKNRPALVNLLSPVQQAAQACPWVQELVDSGRVYQPAAWTAPQAYRLLRSVPALEEAGLFVRLPNWWKKRPRPRVSVTIGNQRKSNLGMGAMLDFDAQVALGDETLSPEELEALLQGADGLVSVKGQWVEVDRERLREAIDHWDALRKEAGGGEVSFVEGMRMLAGASADLSPDGQAAEENSWFHVDAGDGMRSILAGLREPGRLGQPDVGDALKATLRPYQQEGLAWLRFLTELGLGACLADDMGLGKTIQTLALLLWMNQNPPADADADTGADARPPSLLVAPASLLGNWKAEAARFAPSLKVVFLHPSENDPKTLADIAQDPAKHLAGVDLAVTTYAMVTRQEWLTQQPWRLVILDEAQAIKNPGARQTQAIKRLSAPARIALTGTPVENRLGDLWSLFGFLNPGLLGSARVFKSFIKSLEGAEGGAQYAPLRRLVGPYILRRLKTDKSIISDLPDKTETTRFCRLTRPQVQCYEKIVNDMREALELVDGIARRGLVLQTLMRLKQVCNHPSQYSGDGEYDAAHSGKFVRLAEICEEIAERQEKTLVFTQFREIIDPLADRLAQVFGRRGLALHGGTSVGKRKDLVAQFQAEDGPPFFILSLKAGGTGLNLTAASHVIHFDRWWNPAVENQATDRAFRIGQRRNVLVHKFVTTGTVEERIDKLISEKRALADEVLGGEGEVNLTQLPDDELLQLVRLDVHRAMQ